jgi:U2 small nuclear ribonucleoprotein A'
MKLTVELIDASWDYCNTIKDRELDLRSNHIPMLQNVSATKDQHHTLDLTDNDIYLLGGFPRMIRLQMLLIANNNIDRIEVGIGKQLPRLEYLQLAGNNLEKLEDLDPLAELKNLKVLCLLGNPVCLLKGYREAVAIRIPQLQVLDWQPVMGTSKEVEPRLEQVKQERTAHLEPSLKQAIEKASTLEEVALLEHSIHRKHR